MRAVLEGDDRLVLDFRFNWDLISSIKNIPGRIFDPKRKVWSVPATMLSARLLQEIGFSVPPEFQEKVSTQVELYETFPPHIGERMLPFQRQAVTFLKEGRGLLADEQGLGKTISSIGVLAYSPAWRPALIVCPSFLKYNWKDEIERWLPNERVQILNGRKSTEWAVDSRATIYIINYDVLSEWAPVLKEIQLGIIIADEAHYIKSREAKRSKALMSLVKHQFPVPERRRFIALSGTPVLNRPVEFFNILHLLAPDIFNSFMRYAHRYCGARHNGYGWVYNGATYVDELREILVSNKIMLRRLKEDVLSQLPKKMYSYIPIEMSHESEILYLQTMMEASNIKSVGGVLPFIARLRSIAGLGKTSGAIEWIESQIQDGSKLVVFAVHHDVIDAIYKHFRHCAVKVDGRDSSESRHASVQKFQNDSTCQVFIGQVKAAGVGLTLTAASKVAFIELPWTPGELMQAEDRVHRIGQEYPVTVYFLLAKGTIDSTMSSKLDAKRKLIDRLVDGQDTPDEDMLTALMEEIGVKLEKK